VYLNLIIYVRYIICSNRILKKINCQKFVLIRIYKKILIIIYNKISIILLFIKNLIINYLLKNNHYLKMQQTNNSIEIVKLKPVSSFDLYNMMQVNYNL
jgi:hypothetical protein